jgi:hypothetical protein
MVLNNNFEAPYNKFAPEGPVPIISKSIVKARLSNKFAEVVNINNNENDFNLNDLNKENLINQAVLNKSTSTKKTNLKESRNNIQYIYNN